MNKIKMSIWGREFQLPACLERYDTEEVLPSQEAALKVFLDSAKEIEAAKKMVEKHIICENKAIFPNGVVDNVFKYVMPKSIFVPHDKKHAYVILLCNYKFDVEHGLAVIFDNGKAKKVCSQTEAL